MNLRLREFLNTPWTLAGLALAIISIPRRISLRSGAIIITVKSFWWNKKGARAATMGQVVLLGSRIEGKDLEHELIHVEQFLKYPFIFPLLYGCESLRKGYRHNRFEREAYIKS